MISTSDWVKGFAPKIIFYVLVLSLFLTAILITNEWLSYLGWLGILFWFLQIHPLAKDMFSKEIRVCAGLIVESNSLGFSDHGLVYIEQFEENPEQIKKHFSANQRSLGIIVLHYTPNSKTILKRTIILRNEM